MESYGDRIAELRIKAGITQADLAFDCGWRTSRLSNYETGYRIPALHDLEVLCEALDKYLGSHTIVYITTGSFIDELWKPAVKKKSQFTSEKAVAIFRETISDAIELGYIRLKPSMKPSDLVSFFSKACGASIQTFDAKKEKS